MPRGDKSSYTDKQKRQDDKEVCRLPRDIIQVSEGNGKV
jgi:hypothetical protein